MPNICINISKMCNVQFPWCCNWKVLLSYYYDYFPKIWNFYVIGKSLRFASRERSVKMTLDYFNWPASWMKVMGIHSLISERTMWRVSLLIPSRKIHISWTMRRPYPFNLIPQVTQLPRAPPSHWRLCCDRTVQWDEMSAADTSSLEVLWKDSPYHQL